MGAYNTRVHVYMAHMHNVCSVWGIEGAMYVLKLIKYKIN